MVKNPRANVGDARDAGSIPGWGRSPGGGYGKPLQYSCLENPRTEELAGHTPWGRKDSDTTELSPNSTTLSISRFLLSGTVCCSPHLWETPRSPQTQPDHIPFNSPKSVLHPPLHLVHIRFPPLWIPLFPHVCCLLIPSLVRESVSALPHPLFGVSSSEILGNSGFCHSTGFSLHHPPRGCLSLLPDNHHSKVHPARGGFCHPEGTPRLPSM